MLVQMWLCCNKVCGFGQRERVSIYSANTNPAAGHAVTCRHADLCLSPPLRPSTSVCVCVCVCVYVCEQALVTRPLVLAESRCTGVSESFLFMRSVLLEVGHFPKVLALFPPLSPPFSSSLSLSDSFVLNSGNQYPSLFPLLLFSLGQHSLHISMTYEHHKSQPKLASLHFVSPFSQKWGSMREDRGPSLTFRSLLSRK